MTPGKPVHPRRAEAAFSLVELLVALVIGSAVLVTVAVAFGTFTSGPRSKLGRETVTLGATVLQELYDMEGTTLSVSSAPSYGSRILADQMRDMFWDDVRHANAVFCLGRSGRNSVRPLTIPISVPGRLIDTPGRFLGVLSAPAAYPAAAAIFTNYRNASTASNGSIFILEPSEDFDELAVRAIYEIDFVQTANPRGTYATVQRYAVNGDVAAPAMGTTSMMFYDVFYPHQGDPDDPIVNDFSPLFVFFERKVLLAVDGDTAADPFKVAEAVPFSMIWWPDPTSLTLEATPVTYDADDPRAAYADLGGMTSYFFVVPMTPPL